MEWYGSTSSAWTLFSVPRKCPNSSKYSLYKVIPGTTTWRIQTGICFSSRYFANARIRSFEWAVSSLCFWGLMCLMSSMIKSVTSRRVSSLFINVSLSGWNIMPEESIQVWIPSLWSLVNSSMRKSICIIGSPPVTVTPPLW